MPRRGFQHQVVIVILTVHYMQCHIELKLVVRKLTSEFLDTKRFKHNSTISKEWTPCHTRELSCQNFQEHKVKIKRL